MQRDKIRICILRVGGTNRDNDAASCFQSLGAEAKVLHLNDLLRRRNLSTYHGLVLPGGFAYGDYVRAGAILGKKIVTSMGQDIEQFVSDQKPIIGICNGFQVLVEAGILPGLTSFSEVPELALGPNGSGHFECRWVKLLANSSSPCIFTKTLKKTVQFPVAHGEGRFIPRDKKQLDELKEKNLVALRYAIVDDEAANGKYPFNPNGSVSDIAGICNPMGTVFGLMPHPENAFRPDQMPEWIEQKEAQRGDGYGIFDSMLTYIEEKF